MKNYFISLLAIVALGAVIGCGNSPKQDGNNGNQQTIATNKPTGDDLFLMYEMTAEVNDSLQPMGKASLYVSDKAIRSEMKMRINGQEMNMVMLSTTAEPTKTTLLHSKTKTFSKMDLKEFSDNPTMKKMQSMQKDSLTVVGNEKINGYDCTKINILTTINTSAAVAGIIGDNGKTVTQYWMTKDIPGYEKMQKILKSQPKILNGSNAKIYEYGIPVKQITKEGGKTNMIMELKTVEQQDIPDSKFEIPKDYKES